MSNVEPDAGSTDSSHVVGLPQETRDVLESHRAVGEGGQLGEVYENVGEPLIISEKLPDSVSARTQNEQTEQATTTTKPTTTTTSSTPPPSSPTPPPGA